MFEHGATSRVFVDRLGELHDAQHIVVAPEDAEKLHLGSDRVLLLGRIVDDPVSDGVRFGSVSRQKLDPSV